MCFFSAPSPPPAPAPVVVQQPPPAPQTAPNPEPPAKSPATEQQPSQSTSGQTTQTIIKESSTPQEQDFAVQNERDKARRRKIRSQDENNTLVTGGAGLLEPAATGNKQLFGA